MIDRRIKFRHIQCFTEIAREGSLKRAAETLHLTQPAISKTLKELEDILGATLLTRSRAGTSLTRQGEVFLHFARASLASLQQGLDEVHETGTNARARLRVGALPSVAAWLMPPVAREFAALAPDAVLQIIDGPHGYLTDRLRLGELDLVIGRLGPPDMMQGLSFTQLYSEEVAFVTRAGHPLTRDPDLRRIADFPVIYPSRGSAIRPLVERYLAENGIGDLPRRIETVSGAFGRVHTRQSDCVWIISAGVVTNEIADGHLVRLPFDTAITQGPVGLMSRPEAPSTPAQDIFRLAIGNVLSDAG
ncbi:pca operon transcription factor PcaQ [Marimonas lutisalis]|uniref:pca operon transcription factor PcaQ n=1 Tax=Marimonas lutisalis TaxID=2545756 RepID=UPI0010F9D484|nr:pca operon transcription factor PcaQ [Marimonas lutisalis]